jgi:hypothetical protein
MNAEIKLLDVVASLSLRADQLMALHDQIECPLTLTLSLQGRGERCQSGRSDRRITSLSK